ncbi:ABC transporter substrate-binding protein [Pseudonocardia sp. MH-G8]|uniref:ABC transporter substrate-binding protein n=1 Tax=Pseudonocardia sp. MH-G8 TaxID=1854588 RepID=UPI0013046673|nr:ABC transporter substrate-binding protein [Pseudonocardia sp. MH-G8]
MNTARMNRTGRGRSLAALVVGVCVLSACSGGGGTQADRPYVYAVGGDPMTLGLNAQFVSAPISLLFSAQIMDPLIALSDDYELSPGLAERWEVSADGLDLTLHLRSGVTWHDGEPFTAEDVKFNFEEIVPIQTYGALLAERIESVEITDPTTVTVHLTTPFGPLLETVASQFMLPKHIYEGTDYVTNQANKEPIGTGPMMFDSYTSGQEVVLTRNPDYWGGEVQVQRGVFTVIPDANARAEALLAGEIDEALLDPSQHARVSANENTRLLEHGIFPQSVVAMFNTQTPQLSDPAVRAAIFAALDRDAIVENALTGLGTPANGFVPPEIDWAVNPEVDFDQDYPRDLDAINRTLDEAGFERGPDGTRFALKVLYITPLTEVGKTVEMAQSMLGEIGIAVEIVGTSGAVFNETVYPESDFDLAFLRTSLGPDPSLGIARWYECNEEKATAQNPSGVCDPEIDAAIAAALDTSDRAERGEALKRMQARAAELMYFAPLAWFDGAYTTISTARWQGQDGAQAPPERRAWMTMTPAE